MACPVGAQSGVLFYFPFSTDERDPTGRRTKIYPFFYGTFADIGIDPTVSATVGQSLGISTYIREENAMYLKNWLGALKEGNASLPSKPLP